MDYNNSQIREIIGEKLHNIRVRNLMCDRLIDGLTIEKLSEKYELSVSQVKRIIIKNSNIIFRNIQK